MHGNEKQGTNNSCWQLCWQGEREVLSHLHHAIYLVAEFKTMTCQSVGDGMLQLAVPACFFLGNNLGVLAWRHLVSH
jgi:hypothetical protein